MPSTASVSSPLRARVRERKEQFRTSVEEARLELAAYRNSRAGEVARREAERQAEAHLRGSWAGRRLLNSPAQVVQAAIAIMALLMIGVVILGKIDNFTPSLNSTWGNTADNISEQSSSTFDFLNLVPFIIVALFILGLMASRM